MTSSSESTKENQGLRWKVAQWAEIRWWKRYLKNKDEASYADWKQNYWKDLLSKLGKDFELKDGQKVLDAGCGPAGIFTILEKQTVTAVDPLLDQYEKELSHFKEEDYPYTKFVCSPLEAYEVKDTFDVVCCLNVINHVHDIEKSTDNLCNALKKNAQLLLSIDAHNHAIFKHVFRTLPGDILHPHQYDLKEYQKMLTSRGLKIQQTVHVKKEFLFDHYLLLAVK